VRKAMLAILAATGAFVTSAASAMPLGDISVFSQKNPTVQQARLVCNEYGRCYRTRGYRRGYYDNDNYGYRQNYGYRRNYGYGDNYRRGYYGNQGPSVTFGFGGGRW
jgi:hypothetical protein